MSFLNKIILLSTTDINGGAAIAAFRLYNALKDQNRDINIIVKKKFSDNNDVILSKAPNKDYSDFEKIIDRTRKEFIKVGRQNIGIILTSNLFPGYDIVNLQDFKFAKIINIHSFRKFLSVSSIESILKSKKKIIFTLHDESLYTGGCVYTGGCDKFSGSCIDCPQLKGFKTNSPYLQLREKLEKWSKFELNIIAPSKWIMKQARKSNLLKNANIWHIPNGVDINIFKQIDKKHAKNELNIATNKIVILFGAMSLSIERKGFQFLINALSLLKMDKSIKKELGNVVLATFGDSSNIKSDFGFTMINFGKVKSDKKMSLIYSSADIFLLPSIEDNLPNTMLESMSCGTPVVAFNTGGISDVVKHNENGLIVEKGNERMFADAILNLILDTEKRKTFGINSRKRIENYFTDKIQGQKYTKIYENLL